MPKPQKQRGLDFSPMTGCSLKQMLRMKFIFQLCKGNLSSTFCQDFVDAEVEVNNGKPNGSDAL